MPVVFVAVVGMFLILFSSGCSLLRRAPHTSTPAAAPTAVVAQEFGEAARFDLERRSVDSQPIDATRYFRAYQRSKALPAIRRRQQPSSPRGGAAMARAASASSSPWEPLGPNNVAGRARTLVIDPRNPNVMFTSGAGGGLWKTTDSGNSWRALDDFLPILAIGSLTIDPNNPDVLYAGTGDNTLSSYGVRGGGIYKSTDAGESWRRLENTVAYEFRFVRSLAVSPSNSDRVYAATNKGVMQSLDAGETWTVALDRDIPNRGCQQLALRTDRAPADYLFASCGVPSTRVNGALLNKTEPGEDPNAPNAIFLNKDASGSSGSSGAGNWRIVLSEPDMGNSSIAIAPSNQDVVYVLASSTASGPYKDGLLAVFRSMNGGEEGTFEARVRNTDSQRVSTLMLSNPIAQLCYGRPANQAWFANVIAVDPLNSGRLFASSVDTFRSDDGGATWGQASAWDRDQSRAYAHADHHSIVFHPSYNGQDNQTVYLATDGGIFRTDNALAAVNSSESQLCAGGGGIELVWRPLNTNLATAQFYHGAVYPGGQAFVGGLQDNGTVRGSAGGADFKTMLGGDGAISAIDKLDANLLYASFQNFDFRRSTDGGSTFSLATNGIAEPADSFAFVAPLAVDPKDSRRMWAGARALWRTTNGAASWTGASGFIASRSFSAITVSPHDSNIVLAGTRTGEIFRNDSALTANGSSEWSMSKARTGWVSSILHDSADPMVVYAVYSSFNRDPGDAHVYKSFDGGASWQALDGDQLPDAPYFTIAQHPEDPNTLFVGGDLGIYVSTDGGATWAREDESFPAVPTQFLSVERDGSGADLYAFTYGRGVWRVRLTGDRAACDYALSPAGNLSLNAAGGVISRTLNTADGCAWTAFSDSRWLRIVSAATGAGASALQVLVDVNDTGQSRNGKITIGGNAVTVAQSAAASEPFADEPATAGGFTDLPFSVLLDSRTATSGGGDPTHSCTGGRDSRTIWLRYQAATTQTVTATVIGMRPDTGTNPGTVIAAYPDGALPGAELACASNLSSAPSASSVTFAVTAGQYYLIQLSAAGLNNPGGLFQFALVPAVAATDFLPKILDFGGVGAGAFEERRLLLKNSGNQAVSLTLSIADDPLQQFTITGAATATIPIGGQREWVIRCTPRFVGEIDSTLRFGNTVVPLRANGLAK